MVPSTSAGKDDTEARGCSSKENSSQEENVETIILTSTASDPETLFAKSIVEGDQEGVHGYLKTIRSPVAVATVPLSTQNLNFVGNGKLWTFIEK